MRTLFAVVIAMVTLTVSAQSQATRPDRNAGGATTEAPPSRCGLGFLPNPVTVPEPIQSVSGKRRNAPVAADQCTSVGPQRVAAIIVQFPGGNEPTIQPGVLRPALFSLTGSVAEWYKRTSYDQISLSGEVFGPYTLDRAYSCAELPQMRAAAIRASDRDVDFGRFNRYILVFPYMRSCPFGATATTSCSEMPTSDGAVSASWVYITAFSNLKAFSELLIHELGHNFGLGHSMLLRFPGETLAADDFRAVPLEYGDHIAAMGSGPGDFAAAHKVRLQWLDRQTDVRNIEVNADYVLSPLEDPSGLRALRVRRFADADEWLWLEYRRAGKGGLLVRRENLDSDTSTHLIDMTPPTLDESRYDLGVASESLTELDGGFAWSDPHSNLRIEAGEAGPDGLPVRIRYDDLCALPGEVDVSVSAEAQTIRLPVSKTQDCDWKATSGRSWLSISRSESDAVVSIDALPGSFRRSGNVTIGRSRVRITQNPARSDAVIQSVSPQTGRAPANGPFPVLLQIRDENGIEDIRAVQIAIAPPTGSAPAPCYFRVAVGIPLQISEDGVTFAETESIDSARTGICVLSGSLRQYTPTLAGFRGSLQLSGANLEGSTLSVSIRTENRDGEIGPWVPAAQWTGSSECMVLPSADWNSYLWYGTSGDSLPITATAPGCPWTAATDANWIRLQVSSPAQGPAPRFEMEPNTEATPREGLVFVNGIPVRLLQRPAIDPFFTKLRPEETMVSGLPGIGMLTYFYGLADIVPAVADSPWLRVLSVERDGDRREIRFAFEANPDGTSRTGFILAGGKLFTVLQLPGSVPVTPQSPGRPQQQ